MKYKVITRPPMGFREGWTGWVSLDDGKTWLPLMRFHRPGFRAFYNKEQVMEAAAKVAHFNVQPQQRFVSRDDHIVQIVPTVVLQGDGEQP